MNRQTKLKFDKCTRLIRISILTLINGGCCRYIFVNLTYNNYFWKIWFKILTFKYTHYLKKNV